MQTPGITIEILIKPWPTHVDLLRFYTVSDFYFFCIVFFISYMNIRALPEIVSRKDVPVPIWMFGGEQEAWLLPNKPTADNETGNSLRIWRGINHMMPEMPDDFSTGWTVHGRWNDLTYRRGDGAPMVNFTWVDYMPHATMTEMSFRIWEEFFSKFSRVDGEIKYNPGV